MGAERDDVVGANDALIAEAKAPSQIKTAGQGAKIARGLGGRAGKALIELGAEASQHSVGLFQSFYIGQTEFADQAVLEGAPSALDAALGLGE